MSAFAARQRLVMGQIAVGDKSNEIVAIPALLDMMAIEGAVVTIDAMGCQRAIAEKILAKKADYIIALKGNQGDVARGRRNSSPPSRKPKLSKTLRSVDTKPSMATTDASKPVPTPLSTTWNGCANATIGPA